MLVHKIDLTNIINDFNNLLNNNSDAKDIQRRGILLENPTEVNVEQQLENLFPLLGDVFVSYKDYMNNSELHTYSFNTYFEFYKNLGNLEKCKIQMIIQTK